MANIDLKNSLSDSSLEIWLSLDAFTQKYLQKEWGFEGAKNDKFFISLRSKEIEDLKPGPRYQVKPAIEKIVKNYVEKDLEMVFHNEKQLSNVAQQDKQYSKDELAAITATMGTTLSFEIGKKGITSVIETTAAKYLVEHNTKMSLQNLFVKGYGKMGKNQLKELGIGTAVITTISLLEISWHFIGYYRGSITWKQFKQKSGAIGVTVVAAGIGTGIGQIIGMGLGQLTGIGIKTGGTIGGMIGGGGATMLANNFYHNYLLNCDEKERVQAAKEWFHIIETDEEIRKDSKKIIECLTHKAKYFYALLDHPDKPQGSTEAFHKTHQNFIVLIAYYFPNIKTTKELEKMTESITIN